MVFSNNHLALPCWTASSLDNLLTTPNSNLMTLPEVADYLGMAERTIYQWAQQGVLPAFKLQASWRFRKSEIDDWLESQRSGPQAPNRRLVDPVEPPKTKRQVQREDEDVQEAKIGKCIESIEMAISAEEPNREPTVDLFVYEFGDEIVEESLRRLRKQRKITLGKRLGTRVIRRKG